MSRLVEFGNERLDRNRRVRFEEIGPACFNALHKIEEPLAGDIIADDEVEKLEVLYSGSKNEVHVRISVSKVRILKSDPVVARTVHPSEDYPLLLAGSFRTSRTTRHPPPCNVAPSKTW